MNNLKDPIVFEAPDLRILDQVRAMPFTLAALAIHSMATAAKLPESGLTGGTPASILRERIYSYLPCLHARKAEHHEDGSREEPS